MTNIDGTILDDVFQLERLITRGGMGEIWRGVDVRTGQPVAIKRVPDHVDDVGAQLRHRLILEAKAIAELEHPNVVRHIDAGFDREGNPYLALEWLDGDNLEDLRRRGSLKLPQVLEVVRQTLAGLGACHQRGIVHRDIKPGNIFLARKGDDVEVKLIDFGLALMADRATRMTAAGEIMGTLYYLSPEQARGVEETTSATDLYAIGVVLYELLTGRPPFRAEKPLAVLLKIVTETPPRPRQLRPDLPPWLEEVIVRAMQREPADRFASCEEMTAALTREAPRATPTAPVMPAAVSDALAKTLPPTKPTAPEYRLVSLLCVRPQRVTDGKAGPPGSTYEGSTPEASQPDASKASARRLLAEQVRPAIERAGGVVHELMGGELIGIFGLDETVGDEALRAVRTGLAVRGQVGEAASLLVATVHLLYGDGLQLEADDLDRAIALLNRVPGGELVLDDASRDLTRDRVKLRRYRSREVVTSLASSTVAERPVLGVRTPTVGRENELTYLRELFAECERKGIARAVVISGAPGIGKSRLCRALLPELRARSSLCLEGRAVASKTSTRYNMLADAMAQLAGLQIGDDDDAQRRALSNFVSRYVGAEHQDEVTLFVGEAIGLPFSPTTIRWSESLAQRLSVLRVARTEPQVMRQKIAEATERLMLDAAAEGPVTVIFEDLHWADDESLALLAALTARLDNAPIFFIATCRPELREREDVPLLSLIGHHLDVGPLHEQAMSRLLRAVLGRIAEEHEQLMLDWCDGNPYFAEELVSWMVARKLMAFGKQGWQLIDGGTDIELPVGIEGAIQGRLDRLGHAEKELLKAASVYGEIFWDEGVRALGVSNVPRLLERLTQLDFIAPAGESTIADCRQWFFRHLLTAQVAYRMLPRQRRQQLHLRAAEWLERVGEQDAAVLVHHYQQGGDLLQAANHQARVAERALTDGDLERALAAFEAALEPDAQLTGSQRLQRMLGLARTRILRGEPDEASRLIDKMAELGAAQDSRLAPELLFMRGRILLVRSRYGEAEELLAQVVEGFTAQREQDRAFEAKHTLFWTVWVQGRYDAAGPLAEQMHREAAPARPEHLCSAKLASAFHNIASGDLSAAIILAEQAADHAREVSHPYREVDALAALGAAQELAGLYEPALASFSAARGIADRLKTAHHQVNLQACLGRLHLTHGSPEAALKHYERAIGTAERLGDERSLAIALAGHARALTRRALQSEEVAQAALSDADGVTAPLAAAQLAQALEDAERALELTQERSPPEEAEAMLALAEVLEAQGQADAASQAALGAVDVLDRLGTHEQYEVEILLTAHRCLAADGRGDVAIQYLGRAWRALRRRGARITVPAVRESFHHKVPHNRQVQRLWRKTAHPR
jgi:serine/threonine protein kinase/tetratricopeptide (TPR) repeat protein